MSSIAAAPPLPRESLAVRTRRAVIWRSGGQLGAQLVQWAATFLVIRILSPRDYGLFAMTQAVMVLLNLATGYGLADALVQRRTVTKPQTERLFGLLLILAVALVAVQLAIAPLVARYYRQPTVADLLRAQALLYLATPFIALPAARLSRRMAFRAQAAAIVASSLAGAAAALGGALAGLGVWTLVLAPAVLFGTRAVLMTRAAGGVRPVLGLRGIGGLARFGAAMTAAQMFWVVQSQADILLAGRSFTPHALGLYSTALLLTQIFVSKAMPPLNEVAFAGYARLHNEAGGVAADDLIGTIFVRAARMVMAAALPFGIGLAIVADPLVRTMLGDPWAEAVPLVRILALATPFVTLQVLLAPACDARGRPGIGVGNAAVGALVFGAAFALGVRHGPTGLAWAWAAAAPLHLGVSLSRSLPVIGARAGALATAMAPLAAATLAMAAGVVAIDAALPAMPPFARLATLVTAGAAIHAASLRVAAPSLIDDLAALVRPRSR